MKQYRSIKSISNGSSHHAIAKLLGQLTILCSVSIVGVSLFAATASAAVQVVTFAENNSPSDTVTTFQSEGAPTDLTLFAHLQTPFVNPGFTFMDWSTAQNGSGTVYADGALYSFSSDIVLYAQWLENSVTFYENDSGSDLTKVVQFGSTASPLDLVASLSPTFSNPGYNFAGWTTGENGTGSSYGNGATYDFLNGSTSLYAQWTPATVGVTFAGNGGTVSSTQASYTTGSTPVSLPTPTYPGYDFTGWFSAPAGGSFVGPAGTAFTPTSPVTLYAQWKKLPPVAVRFSVNGGRGTVAALSSYSGATIAVPARARVTRSGYRFTGWNTSPSGRGTAYRADEQVTLASSMVLYAQWQANSTVTMLGSVEPFPARAAAVPGRLIGQVDKLAAIIVGKGYSHVIVYGFTTEMGTTARQRTTSAARAQSVARLLRVALARRRDRAVNVRAVGEGSVRGLSAANSRRVEIVGQ